MEYLSRAESRRDLIPPASRCGRSGPASRLTRDATASPSRTWRCSTSAPATVLPSGAASRVAPWLCSQGCKPPHRSLVVGAFDRSYVPQRGRAVDVDVVADRGAFDGHGRDGEIPTAARLSDQH